MVDVAGMVVVKPLALPGKVCPGPIVVVVEAVSVGNLVVPGCTTTGTEALRATEPAYKKRDEVY